MGNRALRARLYATKGAIPLAGLLWTVKKLGLDLGPLRVATHTNVLMKEFVRQRPKH